MDSYIKLMKAIEPKFNCSGACVTALFWFTQPISTAPDVGCLTAVTNELAGTYVVPGIACIVTAIVMVAIFAFQYLLWCEDKYDDDVEKAKKGQD